VTDPQEPEIRAVIRSIGEKDYTAFLDEAKDRLRYQVEFAQAVIRNLLLVNGGAVLALLTALGNSTIRYNPRGLWWAFFWFGLGLVAALAAYFAAFFSQYFYYNGTLFQAWNAQRAAHDLEPTHDPMPQFRIGDRSLWVGVILATISVTGFLIGSFVALDALIMLLK
jgi:hypothetical protein